MYYTPEYSELSDDVHLQGQGALPGKTLLLDGTIKPLNLAVALRMTDRRTYMLQAGLSKEQPELFGNELGTIIGNDDGALMREVLECSLQGDLHIIFLHLCPQLMMNDIAGIAVNDGNQEEKSTLEIDVLDVDMPLLMGT